MEKIKKYRTIIIIIVLALIASIEGIYILNNKNKPTNTNCEKPQNEVVYKSKEYLEENISNELPDFIKINNQAIISQMHTLIFVISTDKDITDSKIKIEYYDENEELAETDEQEVNLLLKGNKFAIVSKMPILTDKYSGKIKVTMETKDFDSSNYEKLDNNKLNLKVSSNITEVNNEAKINIQGVNSFNQKIANMSGYVLMYEKEKITNIAYFTIPNEIEVGANINIEGTLYMLPEDITKTYDNMEVIINYLY